MAKITTSDDHIARLMGGLKQIDNNLTKLNKAGMFEKAQIAEATIKDTRILMGHMVMTMHSIKNDLHRLNGSEG